MHPAFPLSPMFAPLSTLPLLLTYLAKKESLFPATNPKFIQSLPFPPSLSYAPSKSPFLTRYRSHASTQMQVRFGSIFFLSFFLGGKGGERETIGPREYPVRFSGPRGETVAAWRGRERDAVGVWVIRRLWPVCRMLYLLPTS